MEELVYQAGEWMRSAGSWAYVVAPLLMAGIAVFPIPAEAPAMLNGMLFGPVTGTLITWLGSLAGAQISFELARSLGRPVAERFVRPGFLDRADALVLQSGWWGMLLPRFIPVVSFTALNWGAGLTPVSRGRFFWTTAVGILPGAVLFTASGTALGSLLARLPTAAGWLAAALLLAGVVWMLRRGALEPVEGDAAR